MRAFILLSCIALASAGIVRKEKCITIENKYYDKRVLAWVNNAEDFSYHAPTNAVFFKYELPENDTSSENYTTAYLNLDTKEFSKIPGLNNGFATVLDDQRGEIYLAGDDGIYKFNQKSKSADYVTARGANIWALFFFKQIFYISDPDLQFFDADGDLVYGDQNITVSKIVGNDKEYFMFNDTGLFRVVDDDEENAEFYAEPEDEDFGYKGLASDLSGNVYVFGSGRLYLPNREKRTLGEVYDFGNLHGLAFVRDGIVYSDGGRIFKLTSRKTKCL